MSAILPNARLRFYPLIAIALTAFIFIGFSRTYYLRFLFDLPPIRKVMFLHGLAFTAWLALFIAQTQLIASHRVDLHRKLGVVGVLLALAVVISMTPFKRADWWTESTGAGVSMAVLKEMKPVLPERFGQYLPG